MTTCLPPYDPRASASPTHVVDPDSPKGMDGYVGIFVRRKVLNVRVETAGRRGFAVSLQCGHPGFIVKGHGSPVTAWRAPKTTICRQCTAEANRQAAAKTFSKV